MSSLEQFAMPPVGVRERGLADLALPYEQSVPQGRDLDTRCRLGG